MELPKAGARRVALRRPPAAKLRSGTRVLLVEDHDLVRRGLERMLESVGCEVVAVTSGEEALRVAASGAEFHVVLTDMHMPGGTGEELAKAPLIVELGVPVLITSGDTELRIPAQERGAPRAFLSKPFSREELTAALDDLLRRAGSGAGAGGSPGAG